MKSSDVVNEVIIISCSGTFQRIAEQCYKKINDWNYYHEDDKENPFLKYKFFFERLHTKDLKLIYQMGKTLEREVWDNRAFLKEVGIPIDVVLYDFNCTLNILKRN